MKPILSALMVAALLSTPAIAAPRESGEAKLDKLLAGRVAGEPSHCISLFPSKSSQIIPGQAIVYRQGSTLWVNRPRSGADDLRDDDVLVTRTTTSQLCSIDTVNLIDRASRFQRGFVILGDFVPYRRPSKR